MPRRVDGQVYPKIERRRVIIETSNQFSIWKASLKRCVIVGGGFIAVANLVQSLSWFGKVAGYPSY